MIRSDRIEKINLEGQVVKSLDYSREVTENIYPDFKLNNGRDGLFILGYTSFFKRC